MVFFEVLPRVVVAQCELGIPECVSGEVPQKLLPVSLSKDYSRRPPVGHLSTSKGYPCDLVSRLDFRRFPSPILVFKELLK